MLSSQIANIGNRACGQATANPPTSVAAPLPPRKPWNTGQTCPTTAASTQPHTASRRCRRRPGIAAPATPPARPCRHRSAPCPARTSSPACAAHWCRRHCRCPGCGCPRHAIGPAAGCPRGNRAGRRQQEQQRDGHAPIIARDRRDSSARPAAATTSAPGPACAPIAGPVSTSQASWQSSRRRQRRQQRFAVGVGIAVADDQAPALRVRSTRLAT